MTWKGYLLVLATVVVMLFLWLNEFVAVFSAWVSAQLKI